MKKINLNITIKMTVVFTLMSIMLSLGVGYVVYMISYNQVTAQYSELVFSTAKAAAALVDGDSIDHFLENGPDAEYNTIYDSLYQLKTIFGHKYLYILRPAAETGGFTYIFDIHSDLNEKEMLADLGETVYEPHVFDVAYLAYTTGSMGDRANISNAEYGWLAVAYVPVYDSSGNITAVAGADISMNRVIEDIRLQSFRISLFTIAIIAVFFGILLFIAERQIVRPVVCLSRHIKGFNRESGVLENIKVTESSDELQMMTESFNRMTDDIRLYMNNLATVTADRERIATELDIAIKIQTSMLPSIFPAFPHRDEFDLYASMTSAKEVGGDFYDFFFINDDTLAVVIADVSGKGIPAALFMVIAKTLIKSSAQCKEMVDASGKGAGKSPKEVFETVNNKLCEKNDAGMFVTAFMGYLDIPSGLFRYVNAGHNPPLIKKADGEFELLKTKPAFVLAGIEDIEYTEHETVLGAGDVICLYTDGVTEAVNMENELFSDRRLIKQANLYTGCSAEELINRLKDEVDIFANSAEQADDITMLALKINAVEKRA